MNHKFTIKTEKFGTLELKFEDLILNWVEMKMKKQILFAFR